MGTFAELATREQVSGPPTSLWVCVRPALEGLPPLPPDGETPAELHCTVLYLGEATDYDDEDVLALVAAVERLAAQTAPIVTTTTAVDTLGDEGAVVAFLADDQLAPLREALKAELVGAEFPLPEDKFPEFRPHVTLGYVTGQDAMTVEAVDPAWASTPMTFVRFEVADRGEVISKPELGSTVEVEEEVPVVAIVAAARYGAPTVALANQWHREDGSFAPVRPEPVVELQAEPAAVEAAPEPAAEAKPAKVTYLVGSPVVGGADGLEVNGVGTMPYLTPTPYVALAEVTNPDLAALQAALAGVSVSGTSTADQVLSASKPLRRALLMNPEGLADGYEAIMAALEAGGVKAKDYPFAVQLGDVPKEAVRGLKGTELSFDGVVVVDQAGQVLLGEEASAGPVEEEEAAVPAETTEMAAAPATPTAEVKQVEVKPAESGLPQWQGLLVKEGVPTGDKRVIAEGALTWRELPLPLMLMTQNPVGGQGHDGARLAGRVDWIERREGGEIWGGGVIDSGSEAGSEMARLMTPDEQGRTFLRGVSVDIDEVTEKVEEDDGSEVDPLAALLGKAGKRSVEAGRIMGATAAPFPALQEAQITLVPEALAASLGIDCSPCTDSWIEFENGLGPPLMGTVGRVWTPYAEGALVAGGGPALPPAAWYERPALRQATPVRTTAEGRIVGHVADWSSCHIGFGGACVTAPRSRSGYRYACNKQTLTAEGVMVATCPVVIDSVHPDLRMSASDTQAFYAHTGSAVADVAIYEDEFGIVVAGAMRPELSPAQARAFRGSDISPDWRPINGRREMVGLLCVNTSGFVTPALVASGSDVVQGTAPGRVAALVDYATQDVVALVAAGMVRHLERPQVDAEPDLVEALRAELDALHAAVAPIVDERTAQLAARRKSATDRLVARRRDRRTAAVERLVAGRRARRQLAISRLALVADDKEALAEGEGYNPNRDPETGRFTDPSGKSKSKAETTETKKKSSSSAKTTSTGDGLGDAPKDEPEFDEATLKFFGFFAGLTPGEQEVFRRDFGLGPNADGSPQKRDGAPLLHEDDERIQDTSPEGGKVADFKGEAGGFDNGIMVYDDGWTFDGYGWRDPQGATEKNPEVRRERAAAVVRRQQAFAVFEAWKQSRRNLRGKNATVAASATMRQVTSNNERQQLANPYHDEAGLFAPKGAGRKGGGGGKGRKGGDDRSKQEKLLDEFDELEARASRKEAIGGDARADRTRQQRIEIELERLEQEAEGPLEDLGPSDAEARAARLEAEAAEAPGQEMNKFETAEDALESAEMWEEEANMHENLFADDDTDRGAYWREEAKSLREAAADARAQAETLGEPGPGEPGFGEGPPAEPRYEAGSPGASAEAGQPGTPTNRGAAAEASDADLQKYEPGQPEYESAQAELRRRDQAEMDRDLGTEGAARANDAALQAQDAMARGDFDEAQRLLEARKEIIAEARARQR